MVEETQVDPISQTLGPYRLVYELTRGGMATLYLARIGGPGGYQKVVAIKRVHTHLASDPQFVAMFLDEAKLAARLVHPNLVGVLDFGQDGEDYYLAMEYVVGETQWDILKAIARRGSVEPKRWLRVATRLLSDTCEGLHFAHELRDGTGTLVNVVHRDVSPQNILVGFDGVARIIDFGIAKSDAQDHHTATGAFKGKIAYMAPEQIQRKRSLDRRLDVFALGVVAWESVTLRRLFRREDDASTMYAVLESEVPVPSEVNPHIPPALDEVILKALARDPAERYQTIQAFGRGLLQAMRDSDHQLAERHDVTEFLRELFPGVAERRNELVELARVQEHPITNLARKSRAGVQETSFTGAHLNLVGPTPAASRAFVGVGVVAVVAIAASAYFLRPKDGSVEEAEAPRVAAMDPAEPSPLDRPPEEAAPPIEAPAEDIGLAAAGEPPAEDALAVEPEDTELETAAAGEPPSDTSPENTAPSRAEPAATVVSRRSPARTSSMRGERAQPVVERAPEPVAGPGTLVIVAPGTWARVLDARGRILGETPLRVSLPAGEHDVEVRIEGQPPGRRMHAEIRSGERTRLVVQVAQGN